MIWRIWVNALRASFENDSIEDDIACGSDAPDYARVDPFGFSRGLYDLLRCRKWLVVGGNSYAYDETRVLVTQTLISLISANQNSLPGTLCETLPPIEKVFIEGNCSGRRVAPGNYQARINMGKQKKRYRS